MIACLFLLACPLHAKDTASGSLIIKQPWSRATPGGAKVAGGYLTIENRGAEAERLLSASTRLAQRIEIHQMTTSGPIMTMRPIEGGLIIAPGQSVALAPGGTHLMFEGLKAPLKQGDELPVTLSFEHAGELEVSFDVQSLGAQAPPPVAKIEAGSRDRDPAGKCR